MTADLTIPGKRVWMETSPKYGAVCWRCGESIMGGGWMWYLATEDKRSRCVCGRCFHVWRMVGKLRYQADHPEWVPDKQLRELELAMERDGE